MSSKYLAFLLIASLAMAATPPVLNAQPCGTGTNCRFVNPYATGDVDGLTWNTAYRDLQAALMAESTPRVFWVRGETYYYPGTDRDDQFAVQAGDILYGGFAGNEDDLSDRPQPLLDTFLSGDFDGEPHGDNCFVLITMPQNNQSTRIDDFSGVRAAGQGMPVRA